MAGENFHIKDKTTILIVLKSLYLCIRSWGETPVFTEVHECRNVWYTPYIKNSRLDEGKPPSHEQSHLTT